MADGPNLQGSITIDSTQLQASLAQIVAGFNQVGTSGAQGTAQATAGLNETTAAAERAREAARAAAEAHGGFGEALEQLGTHSRTLEVGLDALGLSAAESAAKVEGLTEAFALMEAINPIVLGVAAALATVAAGFEFMTDAVKDASNVQQSMEALGAAVQTQGGNWDSLKDSVTEWADTVAMATGQSQAQLIASLQELVTEGHSYAQAQELVNIASETATATNKDYNTVLEAIINAELGRPRGLEQIDATLKPLIENHASLQQVMSKLNDDMEKGGTQTDTLALAHNRLKAETEALSTAIGDKLLPYLTQMQYSFIGALHNAQLLGQGIGDVFSGIVAIISKAAEAAERFAMGILDISGGNLASGVKELAAGAKDVQQSFHGATGQITKGFGEMWKELSDKNDAATTGRKLAGNYVKAFQDEVKNHIGDIGTEPITPDKSKAKTGNDGSSAEDLEPAIQINDKYANTLALVKAQQDSLTTAIDQAKAGLDPYVEAVNSATTVAGKASAQNALQKATLDELHTSNVDVTSAIALQSHKLQSATADYQNNKSAADTLAKAHDDLVNKIHAAGKETKAQSEELKALANKYKLANDATEKSHEIVTTLTEDIKKNTDTIRENNKAIADQKDSLAAAQVEADKFYQHANEQMAEDLATAKMTDAQKLAYDTDMFQKKAALAQQDLVNNQAMYAEDEQAAQASYSKILEDYKTLVSQLDEANKQAVDDAKKMYDDETKDVSSFIDDVVTKHKSLADELKSIFQDIEKSWVQSFSQMLVKSSGFQDAFGGMFGGKLNFNGANGSPQLSQETQAQVTAENNLTAGTKALQQAQADLKTSTDDSKDAMVDLKSPLVNLNQPITNLGNTVIPNNTQALQQLTQAINQSNQSNNSPGGLTDINMSNPGGIFNLPSLDLSNQTINALTGSPAGISYGSAQYSLDQDPAANSANGGGSAASVVSAVLGLGTGSNSTGSFSSGGGSGFGGIIGDLFGGGGSSGGSGGFGSLGGLGSLLSSGNPFVSAGISDILGGMGVGDLLNGLIGGNSTWGSVGSTIGSTVGMFAGGPLGSLIGGGLGGLLGGLFGPNWGPPSNYPDRSDTQRYGTIMADLVGSNQSNGSYFNEDSETLKLFQGQTGLAGVEELLAQGQSAFMSATGLSAAQYQQALALFGASATGSGQFNWGTHIGDEWVTGAQGATGDPNNPTQYIQYGQMLSAIESGLSSSSYEQAMVYQITHGAPDFRQSTLKEIGSYSSTGVFVPNPPAASSSSAAPQVVNNGIIVGPGGLDEFIRYIMNRWPQIQRQNSGNMNGAF